MTNARRVCLGPCVRPVFLSSFVMMTTTIATTTTKEFNLYGIERGDRKTKKRYAVWVGGTGPPVSIVHLASKGSGEAATGFL